MYKVKTRADGSVERYKARLVARGFSQQYGLDYDETFSPMAKITIVCVLIALAASKSWKLWQMDVKNVATTTAPATSPATAMAGSSWARPYVSTSGKAPSATKEEEDTRRVVTLRDALFVVEKERGHGAGRGAAHGWVR